MTLTTAILSVCLATRPLGPSWESYLDCFHAASDLWEDCLDSYCQACEDRCKADLDLHLADCQATWDSCEVGDFASCYVDGPVVTVADVNAVIGCLLELGEACRAEALACDLPAYDAHEDCLRRYCWGCTGSCDSEWRARIEECDLAEWRCDGVEQATCLTGPRSAAGWCWTHDLDYDGDIDLRDIAVQQNNPDDD